VEIDPPKQTRAQMLEEIEAVIAWYQMQARPVPQYVLDRKKELLNPPSAS
jgi:hypothetical protein